MVNTFWAVTERVFRKNPKHRNIYKGNSDFLPKNTLVDGSVFWISPRIHG